LFWNRILDYSKSHMGKMFWLWGILTAAPKMILPTNRLQS